MIAARSAADVAENLLESRKVVVEATIFVKTNERLAELSTESYRSNHAHIAAVFQEA